MDPLARGRLAGGALIAAALVEIVAMAHHPAVGAHDIAEAVQQIDRMRTLAAIVHGALMALMLTIAYGLSEFALRRGATRPAIRAGIIAYGCGVLVMIGAAMVSGFIVPGVTALVPHATPTELSVNAQLLLLCRVMNQSCANFAAVAMSAGIAFWSWDIVRREAGWRRALGFAGLGIGVLPAVALMLGFLHLDVRGMSQVVLLQALWTCGIGIGFLREPTAWLAVSPSP